MIKDCLYIYIYIFNKVYGMHSEIRWLFFFSSVFMHFLFELYNINGKKLRILESVARFLNMGWSKLGLNHSIFFPCCNEKGMLFMILMMAWTEGVIEYSKTLLSLRYLVGTGAMLLWLQVVF